MGFTTLRKMKILPLLAGRKIHFRSTLNGTYNKYIIVLTNYFLLRIKRGLPRSIHLILHQLSSISPAKLSIHFLCHSFEYIFFSRFDTITKQKDLCEKFKNSKISK